MIKLNAFSKYIKNWVKFQLSKKDCQKEWIFKRKIKTLLLLLLKFKDTEMLKARGFKH